MEHAHKQRLIGGLVLAALLLILVPAILDFSQERRSPLETAEMPESPDAMKMEVLPLEVWSQKIDPEVDNENRILEEPAPAPTVQAKPEEATPARETVKQSEPQAAVPPQVKAAPKVEAKSTPVVPAGATAWVVQVASFSDEPKALALRDKLRKAGHPIFVERAVSSGQTIYRVKAGPVLQRDEADKLQAQIAREARLKGLVMQYR
jgi:DedD protein